MGQSKSKADAKKNEPIKKIPTEAEQKQKIDNLNKLVKNSPYKNLIKSVDIEAIPPANYETPSKKPRMKLIDNLTCESFVKKIKYNSTKVIDSNSSYSETGQLIANEKDDDSNQDSNRNKIFVKLFAKLPQNTTYFVEAMIYNEIIPILLAKATPFLVPGIKLIQCGPYNEFIALAGEISDKENFSQDDELNIFKFIEKLKKQESRLGNPSYSLFMNLSKGLPKTKTLDSVINELLVKKNNEFDNIVLNQNLKQVTDLIFQAVWTIFCLSKLDIRHNDTHLNNFLVETLDQPETFYFNIYDEIFEMKSKYKIYLFDWDRGTICSKFKNPDESFQTLNTMLNENNLCPEYGCNRPNQGFDITVFLIILLRKFGYLIYCCQQPAFSVEYAQSVKACEALYLFVERLFSFIFKNKNEPILDIDVGQIFAFGRDFYNNEQISDGISANFQPKYMYPEPVRTVVNGETKTTEMDIKVIWPDLLQAFIDTPPLLTLTILEPILDKTKIRKDAVIYSPLANEDLDNYRNILTNLKSDARYKFLFQ